ncbi:transglycosylase SLT domain protein [Bacillus clarus]|uniref:Transglycosylase SLT domain protein n=1 Tax=Bacillus clarus TaxID=2338372 RepID=A0A090ZFB0_9BACI|nr:lytic transglycosylase domain-containing protein [Bacillus clarus]KFN02931.1 transglycosylase SLT domain protein [Bacillus clarus]
MIENIVKEVLLYKKRQIKQKLSNPQMVVSSSRFQEKLQGELVGDNIATMKSAKVEDVSKLGQSMSVGENNQPVEKSEKRQEEKEFLRRFPNMKNEHTDMWRITDKYNIQNIHYKNEEKYVDIIDRVSRTYRIPKILIRKMIEVESNFNPNTVSHAGAMGLMQLMPANVKELGVRNPFEPAENIEAGVKELSGYLKKNNGDLVLALASYNAGPGNVRKYGGVPPFQETQGYIRKILNIDVTK